MKKPFLKFLKNKPPQLHVVGKFICHNLSFRYVLLMRLSQKGCRYFLYQIKFLETTLMFRKLLKFPKHGSRNAIKYCQQKRFLPFETTSFLLSNDTK